MRIIKKILFWLLILIVLFNIAIVLSGHSFVYKTLIYQYADIDDYTIFENRTIKAGNHINIAESSSYNKVKPSAELRNFLYETETVAFLILKNDSVVFEEYSDGYSVSSISNSFSIAKSIVSILVGIAIDEGKIKNEEQKVSEYIPEFADGLNAQLTIKHLLTMSAGFDWDESYNSLLSPTTKAYYGSDLKKMVRNLRVIDTPGIHFNYQSCNQLVLACVLEKATGMTLSDYASEKLWKPLGAENDALWSLDSKNGFEKAYCCFNSTARDFSRIGTLMLHHGVFNGQRIISEDYLLRSVTPTHLIDEDGEQASYYGYSWWLAHNGEQNVIYAKGIAGQYIIIIPDSNMVIVRLGKKIMARNGLSAAEFLAKSVINDF